MQRARLAMRASASVSTSRWLPLLLQRPRAADSNGAMIRRALVSGAAGARLQQPQQQQQRQGGVALEYDMNMDEAFEEDITLVQEQAAAMASRRFASALLPRQLDPAGIRMQRVDVSSCEFDVFEGDGRAREVARHVFVVPHVMALRDLLFTGSQVAWISHFALSRLQRAVEDGNELGGGGDERGRRGPTSFDVPSVRQSRKGNQLNVHAVLWADPADAMAVGASGAGQQESPHRGRPWALSFPAFAHEIPRSCLRPLTVVRSLCRLFARDMTPPFLPNLYRVAWIDVCLNGFPFPHWPAPAVKPDADDFESMGAKAPQSAGDGELRRQNWESHSGVVAVLPMTTDIRIRSVPRAQAAGTTADAAAADRAAATTADVNAKDNHDRPDASDLDFTVAQFEAALFYKSALNDFVTTYEPVSAAAPKSPARGAGTVAKDETSSWQSYSLAAAFASNLSDGHHVRQVLQEWTHGEAGAVPMVMLVYLERTPRSVGDTNSAGYKIKHSEATRCVFWAGANG